MPKLLYIAKDLFIFVLYRYTHHLMYVLKLAVAVRIHYISVIKVHKNVIFLLVLYTSRRRFVDLLKKYLINLVRNFMIQNKR